MKKLLLAFALISFTLASAQIPQGISYQAVALNGTTPVPNSTVGVRLSILDGSASGTAVYVETHSKPTNAQGVFNLVIGQGSVVSGAFAGINWAGGAKFLKVEMDAAGGTNYALVGTAQLLTSPYAMVAGNLVLAPGQGITLTSPNGTPYTVSVNDAGQLSLPTSYNGSALPVNFFMYGSFNGYDPATALQMGNTFEGYKYLTAGSQVKFLSGNTPTATVYGLNGSGDLVPNGAAYNIASTAFYHIFVSTYYLNDSNPNILYIESFQSIAPAIFLQSQNGDTSTVYATYNSSTNTFSFIANGVTTGAHFVFTYPNGGASNVIGDNLADGNIDIGGVPISAFPGINSTPKNYRIDLVLNFNGSGTYTITQI